MLIAITRMRSSQGILLINMQFNQLRFRILLTTVVILVGFPCGTISAAPTKVSSESIALPLRQAIGELRVSRTPVLLPGWLPPLAKRIHADVGEGPFKDGYEVWLGSSPHPSSAETLFYVHGGRGSPRRNRRTVPLSNGCVGYFHGGNF